jgi:hypothetical protein
VRTALEAGSPEDTAVLIRQSLQQLAATRTGRQVR